MLPSHHEALGVLGRALQGAMVHRDMTAATHSESCLHQVAHATGGELIRYGDNRWRPVTPADAPILADEGLTTPEALGFGLAMRWSAAKDHPLPIRGVDGGYWVSLPTTTAEQLLQAADALPICRAMLVVRRVLVPRQPWGRRDPVAERFEFLARRMSAALEPPKPIEHLRPAVILSDLGRDWSGRYDARG